MKLKNYTSHDLNFHLDNGLIVTVPTDGLARVETDVYHSSSISMIPVFKTSYGTVTGLPDKENGTALIVSRYVAQALPERNDLYVVETLIRNEEGYIVGAKGVTRLR